MKKSIFLAVAAVAMTACSNDVDLGMKDANKQTADNAIGFSVLDKNMSRANLQDKGHYNFGVFAYKTASSTSQTVFDDYLVGYNGTNKGYYMTTGNQTTLGDQPGAVNGESQWAYEKLGSSEYSYTADDGFYKNTDTRYMSNWANQFLRYWDYSSTQTDFYAYAPYVNKTFTSTVGVKFDFSTKIMTFPGTSIKAGYSATDNEYMFASQTVSSTNYNKDVTLGFKRMNAKINIKFYEEVAGYRVEMVKLTESANITAVPAKRAGTSPSYTYSAGTIYSETGAKVDFSGANATVALENYTNSSARLDFALPTLNLQSFIQTYTGGATFTDVIGETPADASGSETTYYAIPKNTTSASDDAKHTGLTFHVSFKLISIDTNETLTVKDATVFVPAEYCHWDANYAYTYIFRITKDATGSTGNPSINPDSPNAGTDNALKPIVFDNCVVEEWENATGIGNDHNIN